VSKDDLNQPPPWKSILLGQLIVAQLVNKFFVFCGPEDSLACTQEPATCPYPEPDKSNLPSLVLFF
jgi:hypothetical protein